MDFSNIVTLVTAVAAGIASTAALVFLAYSALNGLTLSCIFLVYTSSSISSTFLRASV